MSVDIHKQEIQYNRKKELIDKFPASKNKTYLQAYAEWHDYQIEMNKMAYSSSVRSLRHALNLADRFYPDMFKATQSQVENWFDEELNKEKVIKTSTGYLKPLGKKRSSETLEDFSTQAIKFFKFVNFLNKDKPLRLFSSKRSPLPTQCEFIGIDLDKDIKKEKPKVSQEEVKELINWLRTKGNYNYDMTGVLASLLNDVGLRFSEACTLRIKDLEPEEDYLVITIQQSKTKTRTVTSILAKPHIINWLATHPLKDNPDALLFCNKKGEPVHYDSLRRCLLKGIKAVNIDWKNNSSFHFFRHIFASRAMNYPDFYLRYWMGWRDKSMRAHYTGNTYKECVKFYKKMLSMENNCMLNVPLTGLEVKDKSNDKTLETRVKAMEKLIDIMAGGSDPELYIKNKVNKAVKS